VGDEGTEFQLKQNERDIKDVKEEVKEVKIDVKDIKANIIKIEKTDIRIEINVQSILDTYKIMRNTTIGFVVLNVLTMIWTLSQK